MASERGGGYLGPVREDQPSFFGNWESRTTSTNRVGRNSGSHLSSDNSHLSVKTPRSSPRARKPRLVPRRSSASAPAGSGSESAIPTVGGLKNRRQCETSDTFEKSSTKLWKSQSRSRNLSFRQEGSVTTAAASSNRSSPGSATRRFRSRVRASVSDLFAPQCHFPRAPKEPFLPREEKSGNELAKASSKDEWPQSLISTSGIMRRRAERAASVPESSPAPTLPLRPPLSRNLGRSTWYGRVNLETPFPKSEAKIVLDQPEGPLEVQRSSVTARARAAIASRVQLPRHRSGASKRATKGHGSSTTPSSPLVSAKNRTSQGLKKVASILHFMIDESPPLVTPGRSVSSREGTHRGHLKLRRRKATCLFPAVVRDNAQKSLSGSYTSSIRKMRRGPTPLNTPESNETYTVKKSASAETEVFSKIDISTRGETSYLPSEAKRIHTPPLPGIGPGEKKMGFFFDYTPALTKEPTLNRDQPSGKDWFPTNPNGNLLRGQTTDRVDWYEAQLAGVDSVDATDDATSEAARVLGVTRTEEINAETDPNVPEHLPNSPLCPKNLKHRSGGTEMCWMHGGAQDRQTRQAEGQGKR